MTARAVAATRATAKTTLMTRERRGSRSTGASDAPAISQPVLIKMIITVSAEALAVASAAGFVARWALANTAAIAIQAFGLAIPSSAPPASEGEPFAAACAVAGGAVAMW